MLVARKKGEIEIAEFPLRIHQVLIQCEIGEIVEIIDLAVIGIEAVHLLLFDIDSEVCLRVAAPSQGIDLEQIKRLSLAVLCASQKIVIDDPGTPPVVEVAAVFIRIPVSGENLQPVSSVVLMV